MGHARYRGVRLTERQKELELKSQAERNQMSQTVKIVFAKKLWHLEYYYGIRLIFKHPLSSQEIKERMMAAFPGEIVVWEEALG